MKQIIALPAVLLLSLSPVMADEGKSELREGMDMLSQGTRLLLEGLMKEVEPALRELDGLVDDLNAYEAPEVLPNGDIIIRRKEPRPVPPEEIGEGEVEL